MGGKLWGLCWVSVRGRILKARMGKRGSVCMGERGYGAWG